MKLSPEEWTAISALASAASAIFAAAALIISSIQTRANARAISFNSAQQFSTQCRELLNECRNHNGDVEKFELSLAEILASFELFCIALQDLDMSNKSREYITETIIDYLSDMEGAGYGATISKIVSKSHVCKELKNFTIQHRMMFQNRSEIADMLCISRASLS